MVLHSNINKKLTQQIKNLCITSAQKMQRQT